MNDSDIRFVSSLVEEAGSMAVSMREGVEINLKSGPEDKVTAADLAISKMICRALAERFPDDTVLSEEDIDRSLGTIKQRAWIIDPIDGTQNYILDDGQYCVMVGLVLDGQPVFGWVFAPAGKRLYFGGPGYGAFKQVSGNPSVQFSPLNGLDLTAEVRLLMGSRDRRAHPWVFDLDNVSLIKTGSIGLKVGCILDNQADIFAHLSRKLKIWDTAGPAAIALGAGLEVGTAENGPLTYTLPNVLHDTTVIMGRPGAIEWCHNHLYKKGD